MIYRIAQNVGGVKHWQIPLKIILANSTKDNIGKKNIGDLACLTTETLLPENVVVINKLQFIITDMPWT